MMRKLYNRFSDLLGGTPLHPQFFSKRFLRREMKRAAPRLHGLVADLGCGAGPYKKFLTKSRYIGLDYPATLAQEGGGGPDALGDLLNLPFAAGSLDGVMCTQVLEHVRDPARAAAEIGRVLKPSGKLILSVPFIYPLHDEPYDFFRYSPNGLEALLSQAGLEVLEIRPQGGFITLACESANLFGIHKILNLLKAGGIKQAAGLLLTPPFLLLACLGNLICLLLSPLDRERRFVMNYFILARRQ